MTPGYKRTCWLCRRVRARNVLERVPYMDSSKGSIAWRCKNRHACYAHAGKTRFAPPMFSNGRTL